MSEERPSLRPLVSEDAAKAAELHASAFDEPWSAAELATMLEAAGTFGVGVALGERLVGFILVRGAAGDAEVLTVAVAPEARRRGIATALVEAACGLARTQDATVLFLEVAEDNVAARALYAACGFTTLSRRHGYYRRRDAHGRLLAVIDALVLERKLGPTHA